MPSVNPYDLFAKYYDQLHYNDFSLNTIHYIDDILAKLGFTLLEMDSLTGFMGTQILDVGCGTGTLSLWLGEQGYDVTAIDLSKGMIQSAKQKAKKANLDIHFQNTDIRKLKFTSLFDLALSIFDTMNHLTKYTDLQKAMKNIHKALKPKGYFLFDMITPYELLTQWNHGIRYENNGNVSLLLHSNYHRKNRLAEISGKFVVRNGKRILTHTRQFYNKAYTRKEINSILRHSGFKLIHAYDCFTFNLPDRKSNRIFYITQKI